METERLPKWPVSAERITSAAEVAFELRQRLPGIEDVKLHKLLYYVQGKHLVWQRRPAFAEAIEAWERGPVVAQLWHDEQQGRPAAPEEPLPETVNDMVTNTIACYGDMTEDDLIAATHAEDPWRDATDNGRNINQQVISHAALIEFMGRLSPELRLLRSRIANVRDNKPFAPDPPGALNTLRAKYRTA